MPRAFNRVRLIRVISTSAVAGLASVAFFTATASAEVNSVRIDGPSIVDVDRVSGIQGLRIVKFTLGSGDAGSDADGGMQLNRDVNSV